MVGDIREPGFLEGGDFFPAGRELALLGIGLRCAAGLPALRVTCCVALAGGHSAAGAWDTLAVLMALLHSAWALAWPGLCKESLAARNLSQLVPLR